MMLNGVMDQFSGLPKTVIQPECFSSGPTSYLTTASAPLPEWAGPDCTFLSARVGRSWAPGSEMGICSIDSAGSFLSSFRQCTCLFLILTRGKWAVCS